MIYSKWLISIILLILVSCKKETETIVIENIESDYELIEPISQTESTNHFSISGLEFDLPKGFFVKKVLGPDFTIYGIKYPAGIGGGIFVGQFPNAPQIVSNLISQNPIIQIENQSTGQLKFIQTSLDSLKKMRQYSEICEQVDHHPITYTYEFMRLEKEYLSEVDYFSVPNELREKFLIRDTIYLEAFFQDSSSSFKTYPPEKINGNFNLVISDNQPYGWRIHFFTSINSYATWTEINAFSDQLIDSENAP
jgi:hypothetical protein